MEVDKPMIKKFIIYVVSVKSVNTNWNFTLNSHTQVIALCFQQLEKHSSKLHFSATHFDAKKGIFYSTANVYCPRCS